MDEYLDAPGARPIAHGFGLLQLGRHTGKLLDKAVELLLGRQLLADGVDAWIQLQTDAAQRIGGSFVIVEGDHPEPAPLEDVVQRAFGDAEGQTVVFLSSAHLVKAGHVDHVGEDGARVRLQVKLAQPELVGKGRAKAGGVDDKVRRHRAPILRSDGDARIVHLHVLHAGGLPDVSAVANGQRREVGVTVLAEEV